MGDICIRHAELNDLGDLLMMGRAFFEAGKYLDKGLNWSDATFMKRGKDLIESNRGLMLVAERKMMLLGSIAAVIQPTLWDDNTYEAHEIWWWVDEWERGKVGMLLLNAFMRIAEKRGCHKIVMITSNAVDEESLKKFYHRKGFKYLESVFVKEIGHGR